MPSWGTTRGTCAIKGLVRLLGRQDWCLNRGPALSETIRRQLDGLDPTIRFLAAHALPAMYPDEDELLAELERRLQAELDHHNATQLMTMLEQLAGSRPLEVDQVLERLASQPQWTALALSHSGDQALSPADEGGHGVPLLAWLAVWHNAPYASQTVRAWLTDPVDDHHRTDTTVTFVRNLLNPSDQRTQTVQDRAFDLIRLILEPLCSTLAEAHAMAADDEELRERVANAARTADNLATQLYFASGAFDDKNPNRPPIHRADQVRFDALALPILNELAKIPIPSVTQHLVETLDHIRATQPKQALLIAAKAVSRDSAYPRESLGLDATLGLVRHYATDYRDLVLIDPEGTAAIRALLEPFARLGWDQAIDLAEELGRLFI